MNENRSIDQRFRQPMYAPSKGALEMSEVPLLLFTNQEVLIPVP